RILHDPARELAERAASMSGKLGHKRCRRHARLGIDLKTDHFPRAFWPVVEAKVGATDPTAAQCPMSRHGQLLYQLLTIWFKRRREDVNCPAGGVFRVIVVKGEPLGRA